VEHFNNSFTSSFSDEQQRKLDYNLPPHLKLVASLPYKV